MHRILDPAQGRQISGSFCALAIMTKAPRPGAVKTRLQPPLSAEEAAALNIAFLRDTARSAVAADELARAIAVYTPSGSEAAYEGVLPREFFGLLPQRGDAFGQRLHNAVADLLQLGFSSCCLIDSDSPTVPAEVFAGAVDFLRTGRDRLVLGPSEDGGYYLIGMQKHHARLFEEIDWSTERVFAQTMKRAADIGLSVNTLPTFFDVDDRAGLHRLCQELLGENRDSAPATKAFLQQLIAREGRERIWAR